MCVRSRETVSNCNTYNTLLPSAHLCGVKVENPEQSSSFKTYKVEVGLSAQTHRD